MKIGKGRSNRHLFLYLLFHMLISVLFVTAEEITVPTDGLVGWYPLAGNAEDFSGLGNHGTVKGAVEAEDRYGMSGEAYFFDGFNDWIEIPDTDANSFSSVYSVLVWFMVREPFPERYMAIIGKGRSLMDTGYNILIHSKGKGISAEANNGIRDHLCECGEPLYPNKWHCVCSVSDGQNMRLYIDGILKKTIDAELILIDSNQPLSIGKETFGEKARFFQGFIDEVIIYDRDLSVEEICSFCDSPDADPEPRSSLFIAAWRENDFERVQKLLIEMEANGESLEGITVNDTGDSPLQDAIVQENLEMVEFLLETGNSGSLNNRNTQGETELHTAVDAWFSTAVVDEKAYERKYDIFSELLKKNRGSIDAVDNSGETPFFRCTDSRVSGMLLQAGADIHKKNNQGMTRIMRSVETGNSTDLIFLLSEGADWSEKFPGGRPLLYQAVNLNDPVMTLALTAEGAYLNEVLQPDEWRRGGPVKYEEVDEKILNLFLEESAISLTPSLSWQKGPTTGTLIGRDNETGFFVVKSIIPTDDMRGEGETIWSLLNPHTGMFNTLHRLPESMQGTVFPLDPVGQIRLALEMRALDERIIPCNPVSVLIPDLILISESISIDESSMYYPYRVRLLLFHRGAGLSLEIGIVNACAPPPEGIIPVGIWSDPDGTIWLFSFQRKLIPSQGLYRKPANQYYTVTSPVLSGFLHDIGDYYQNLKDSSAAEAWHSVADRIEKEGK